ncbi:hypothetical protein [Streptomyces coeruleorubidus]
MQFALTVLYVVTVLSVVSYYSGKIFGILVYDSLPSVAGVYLARRLWRGGVWTSRALIAVQAWIVWLSFGMLMHGDLRGLTQAAMPVAVIVLLRRARSREWFETALQDREDRRAFSLARMIRWRRDDGQTAVEYAGLVAVVAAIIIALSVGGPRRAHRRRHPVGGLLGDGPAAREFLLRLSGSEVLPGGARPERHCVQCSADLPRLPIGTNGAQLSATVRGTQTPPGRSLVLEARGRTSPPPAPRTRRTTSLRQTMTGTSSCTMRERILGGPPVLAGRRLSAKSMSCCSPG